LFSAYLVARLGRRTPTRAMIGIIDVRAITVEGTLFGSQADESARVAARADAHDLVVVVAL
jgi:hypothetical protein